MHGICNFPVCFYCSSRFVGVQVDRCKNQYLLLCSSFTHAPSGHGVLIISWRTFPYILRKCDVLHSCVMLSKLEPASGSSDGFITKYLNYAILNCFFNSSRVAFIQNLCSLSSSFGDVYLVYSILMSNDANFSRAYSSTTFSHILIYWKYVL